MTTPNVATKTAVKATPAKKATAKKATKKEGAAPAKKASKKEAAAPAPRAEKAPKAAKAEKPVNTALEIHINKTGRVCFGKNAAARIGDLGFMLMTTKDGMIRFKAVDAATSDTTEIRRASGRPYISATKFLKNNSAFDGTEALDIEATPFNSHGFEFKA